MNKFLLLFTLFAIFACASRKNAQYAPYIDKVKHLYHDYTVNAYLAGKEYYETKCIACHKLKDPASKTEEEWNLIVPKMVEMANKNAANIDAKMQTTINRYVVTMSKTYVTVPQP